VKLMESFEARSYVCAILGREGLVVKPSYLDCNGWRGNVRRTSNFHPIRVPDMLDIYASGA